MFAKLLTRAPWYILIRSFFVAIGQSYLHDLSHVFLKRLKLLSGEITAKHQDFPFFYCIYNDKNFIPKYLDNVLTDSVLTSRTSRRLSDEKAPVNYFVRTVPSEKNCCKYNR